MSIVEYGEYKGNRLIILKRTDEDKYPFSFGKGKARLIVENFDAIKKFAEEEEGSSE
ncbi:MAG: hypothetical protein WC350_04960 [Candidatus Micrarchaeia archaeon]|jgi:hypothetical protein